ncbi:MAG: glycosyltransferase [Gammaproteobacteria bacterium]|nr:glycosyltransferase [Gammaproteobacteria bacterium]
MNKEELPLVSIVTVVLNGEAHLEQCINSVLAQTYPNIQYVIIDGGSTDGTLDIIRKYADKIAYWSSEPDKGISDAFNKGIAQCKGEIVGMINADDWFENDAVESVVAAMPKFDIVYGLTEFWKKNQSEGVWFPDHSKLRDEMSLNHSSTFIRRLLYARFGGFDVNRKFAMDYDLLLRLLTNGAMFSFLNKKISNMRLDGVSDQNWKKAYDEVRQIKKNHLALYLSSDIYYYKQIVRRHVRDILMNTGLSVIVRWYRKKFSIMKKNNG